MLLPMGLPEHLSAIVWGLQVEHLMMTKCGINNIRELVCLMVNLQMV